MTSFTINAAKIREQLSEAYHGLRPLEQLMVQLFSVIYEPVSRATFVICLNDTQTRNIDDKPFTQQSLKPFIDRLLKLGVLVQESGMGPRCHPFLMETATRDAVHLGWFEMFAKIVQTRLPVTTRWKGGPRYFNSKNQLIREIRIGIYRKDIKYIHQLLEDYNKYNYHKDEFSLADIYQQVCNDPFDLDWFRTLPPEIYEGALASILNQSMLHLIPAQEAFSLLQADCVEPGKRSGFFPILLVEQLILRGRLPEAQQALERLTDPYRRAAADLQGWLYVLQGEDGQAIAHYSTALKDLKQGSGKRKIYFQSMGGLFFILALLKQGSPAQLDEASGYTSLAQQAKSWLSPTYRVLEKVIRLQQGDLSQKNAIPYEAPNSKHHSLEALLRALCLYWTDIDAARSRLPKVLESFVKQADAAGYEWLAMEAAELLSRLKPRGQYGQRAATFRKTHNIRTLVDLLHPQEPWEMCLNALSSIGKDSQETIKPETNKRLAWFVSLMGSHWSIQPREQTITAKGEWGRGRPIALKRLKSKPEEFDYLTAQDHRICTHLKPIHTYGYYGNTDYTFAEKAIADLIGHPLVFWEDSPTTRIEVVKGEPELLVKKGKGDRLTLQFLPELKDTRSIVVVKETPTRLKVIEVSPEHRRIADILGNQNRLEVPESAKERVLTAISGVSSIVTVHSDIGGGVSSAEEVPADPKPHIHLLPAGGGLKVGVLVRPFAEGGPYYQPGAGGETVIAEIGGKRLQAVRNLSEEKKLANGAIAACPTLARQEQEDGEWRIEDPETCLELLLELGNLGDSVVLEWPHGEKLRVTHQADFKHFTLSIKRQNDWFDTDGKLQLDNRLVLDMKQLMELLDQTPSRFVPLGDGQFLALTQEFRKRLDELRAFSEKSGKGLRVHPLAAINLEDWAEEVGSFRADKHWKEHIQRIKAIQTFEPQLPSTLQADLRDYQMDGFRWLARLAEWGVGACLADDMGLGKTLQALAVILTRAQDGPTLIVAPTSVCMNWMAEAARFAPTINTIQFGSGDRQKLLDQLKPFDMLVCSYGLLQQEEVAEMLAKVQWQTIVLDEAQSIKNFATKRSQAAMNLQGGFKLITTGTPIENHLGELWNLFRFINPGLLGSLEKFNERFATPIEKYGDRQARNRLKKLVQPFLLRRTKSQVLEELPSRTEILLHVELSQEEMAFYEALRREAITKLSETDATAGAKHLQVLAEIMRLRRACCNSRLAKPEIALPSSKLQLFGEVLAELLENRHKALVFSQFVDHLQIIRDYLDEQNIHYQYLDGSTPAPERKKRVDAFQSGAGDVFLISLKAGGTGLNLTAADYVIHMDPWWNPAVEDQASDRAHRIGQQRPVTIYRMVAKNTIEEKIVQLHHQKRDLADSLLEGADMSGKVSTEELVRLIQES
ncbi:DEAD/DEAH box helicase [Leptothermofonsia sichuanensis E412]|uniref:DEAD/DEAH box helicase n=1 Tax=Leptothermofonsia sichuanensis TaxID=2917832 RepID=UPI001CA76B6F|nr:DEAD/DEAH box helicase [Leptothermofonsia sichuanensis]QZZ22946.1 DEAD/DEAH box helicase [Leptothermofonsia sichuanensis E412]